jgi:hypothetical protein
MDRPFQSKKVVETFNRIRKLNEKKELQIVDSSSTFNNKKIDVWKSGNHFEFSLKIDSFLIDENFPYFFDSCKLVSNLKNYTFLKDSFLSRSTYLFKDITTGELTSIVESDFNEQTDQYYRIIQPIKKGAKFAHVGKATDLKTDQKNILLYGVGIIQLKIKEVVLDVFRVNEEKEKFIIIDSTSIIGFDQFKKITEAFFATYAFIFGETVGEEAYYVSSIGNLFEEINQIVFLTKASSFNEEYPIIDIEERVENKLIPFKRSVFETICNNYLNIEQYSRTFKIIDEAIRSTSPLSKCILCASALETIASLMYKKNQKPKLPINEERFKKIKDKIEGIINEDIFLTSEEKKYLIEKKLKYWNSQTNKDRALDAFERYGIGLPDSLEKILTYRNFYLHGTIPKGIQFGFETDNLSRAFEIQFLTSVLLLKFSGYSGTVQNKSAILEYHVYLKENNSVQDVELKQSIFYKI